MREVVSCYLSEINTVQRGEIRGTVPESWVLPFAHQRYDHLVFGESDRFRQDIPNPAVQLIHSHQACPQADATTQIHALQ